MTDSQTEFEHTNTGETTPLLAAIVEAKAVKKSGFVGTWANLSNTMVGAGVLALPFAFNMAGLGTGLIFLIIMAWLSGTTLNFMSEIAVKLEREKHPYEYPDVAIRAGNYNKMMKYFGWFLVVYTGGSVCGYCVITYDAVSAFLEDVFDMQVTRLQVLSIVGIFYLFVSQVKNIAVFATSSIIALCCLAYLVLMIMVLFFAHMPPSFSDVIFFEFNPKLALAPPLLTVAFTAHYNLPGLFQVFEPAKGKSKQEQMSKIIMFAVGCCGLFYTISGIFGYLSFQENTCSDILSNYAIEKNSLPIRIAKGSIAFAIIFSYPVVVPNVRKNFEIMYFNERDRNLNSMKSRLLSFGIALFSLFIGVTVHELSTVLNFSGSIAGMTLVFTLPAWYYLRIMDNTPKYRNKRHIAKFSLGFGIFFAIFGFIVACLKVANVGGLGKITCNATSH